MISAFQSASGLAHSRTLRVCRGRSEFPPGFGLRRPSAAFPHATSCSPHLSAVFGIFTEIACKSLILTTFHRFLSRQWLHNCNYCRNNCDLFGVYRVRLGVYRVRLGVYRVRLGVYRVRLGVYRVRLGVYRVRLGVYRVRLGVYRVRLGVYRVRLGVCRVRLGVCRVRLGVCRVKFGTEGVWFGSERVRCGIQRPHFRGSGRNGRFCAARLAKYVR